MRKSVSFASLDHTGGTFIEVTPAGSADPVAGVFALSRIWARVTGNAGNTTVSVYVLESGLGAPTVIEMAEGEVYFNDAIAAAADPSPELNVTGDPIPFVVETGQSIYIYHVGDVNPTSCDVTIYF